MRPSVLNTQRHSWRTANGANLPARPMRPRRHKAPGAATFAPLIPDNAGVRREMRRAALHRLARLAHVRPADLPTEPRRLMAIALGLSRFGDRGPARRLVMKAMRLSEE